MVLLLTNFVVYSIDYEIRVFSESFLALEKLQKINSSISFIVF